MQNQNLSILFLFLLLFIGCTNNNDKKTPDDNWKYLFDGESIDAWEKQGGNATFEIIHDAIVGTAILNTPNTFLCTKEKYSDFILELKIQLLNPLNSGVQFRSNLNEKGIVNGYQCEIDPTPRKFTGGIYDEQRRGWLYPLSRNTESQDAFKMDEWNDIRIECLGNDLRTYVNGKLCSWIFDDETSSGFIGLQVHSVGEEAEGYQVTWKDIKILTDSIDAHRNPLPKNAVQINYLTNQLTDWEKEQGYQLLFDGKSIDGWESTTSDSIPKNGWIIENGMLTLKEGAGVGDIITKDVYENFELELEFMISEGGNSGIKYLVPKDEATGSSTVGFEFQILDDKNHPDAKNGIDGNRTVASLYDLIPADNISTPGRNKQFKGVNKWNHARIVVDGNHIEHWLNNEKALEFEKDSEEFQDALSKSKFKDIKGFAEISKGRILLQDHDNKASFRNIKIRPL